MVLGHNIKEEHQMQTKEFHLGDVLSITTGRLVSPRRMDGIYDILNFMTDSNLFTHQLSRAINECKPHLLGQFPQLDCPELQFALGELIEMLETSSGKEEPDKLILGWLSKLTSGKYGVRFPEMLTVKTIPNTAHKKRDPLERGRGDGR